MSASGIYLPPLTVLRTPLQSTAQRGPDSSGLLLPQVDLKGGNLLPTSGYLGTQPTGWWYGEKYLLPFILFVGPVSKEQEKQSIWGAPTALSICLNGTNAEDWGCDESSQCVLLSSLFLLTWRKGKSMHGVLCWGTSAPKLQPGIQSLSDHSLSWSNFSTCRSRGVNWLRLEQSGSASQH